MYARKGCVKLDKIATILFSFISKIKKFFNYLTREELKMENQNTHIDNFLDYYCTLQSPQYAVMLKGKWGSGKTHYINEYKKKLDEKQQKYLYISLYGVTSYDEIETKFLEQLHPKLYNKKTILAGKIAKGLLRATLKIDLDNDGKDDGSLNSQVPNLSAGDLLNTKDYILIFDDLERCSININDLLGYINYFVEHQDYRVILLANDEKFKDEMEYKDIKEKLIGKIFEVVSNTELAYASFTENIDNPIFTKFKSEILEIYTQSEYNNLRVLRQIIFDFDRFYKAIELNTFKDELVKELVAIFFILAIESRLGKVILSQLLESNEKYLTLLWEKDEVSKEKKKENIYYMLISKYPLLNKSDYILDFNRWNEILEKSLLNIEQIKSELLNSKYYLDENTASWKKLVNFYSLADELFEKILNDVISLMEKNTYQDLNQVLLISSTLLYLNKNKLCTRPIDDIYTISFTHIDFIIENNLLPKDSIFKKRQFNKNAYENLRFYDEDNDNFKIVLDYKDKKLSEYKERIFKEDSFKIIELLNDESNEIYSFLSSSNYADNPYYNKPILSFIDVDSLIQILLKKNGYAQYTFGAILGKRYEQSLFNKNIDSEIGFLHELQSKLKAEQIKRIGKVSGYTLENDLLKPLDKAINDLQTYITNQQGKNEH